MAKGGLATCALRQCGAAFEDSSRKLNHKSHIKMTTFYRRAKRTQNPGLFEFTFGSCRRESALNRWIWPFASPFQAQSSSPPRCAPAVCARPNSPRRAFERALCPYSRASDLLSFPRRGRPFPLRLRRQQPWPFSPFFVSLAMSSAAPFSTARWEVARIRFVTCKLYGVRF